MIAASIWDSTAADLQRISRALRTEILTPEIFVVHRTISGAVETIGNRVYCTRDDIGTGTYRRALISAALGIQEPWILWGAAAYVFGGAWDEDALRKYFISVEDPDMLSLFAAYFCGVFWDQTQLAQDAAIGLCSYVIDQYGIDALLQSGQGYMQEWLLSLGINCIYEDPYTGLFAGYRYTHTDDYPFVAVSARGDVYSFTQVEGNVETAGQIKESLAESALGTKAILAYIKENAPEYYDAVAENYARPIYYIYESPYNASTARGDRQVLLLSSESLLHETVHILIPVNSGSWERWQYEAVATYLPAVAYPTPERQRRFFNALNADAGGDSADDRVLRLAQRLYRRAAAMPDDWQDMDMLLAIKSFAGATLLLPELTTSSVLISSTIGEIRFTKSRTATGGDELTYYQAVAFADYLIRHYGFSSMMRLCMDAGSSFQDVFGQDYAAMKQQWLEDDILSIALD